MPAGSGSRSERVKAARACPICGKPEEEHHRPFCSKRCADVDLHRWLSGGYAIPAAEEDQEPEGEAGQGTGQPKSRPL